MKTIPGRFLFSSITESYFVLALPLPGAAGESF